MMASGRRGRRRVRPRLAPPRLSLALPGILAFLLALLAARTGLALVREPVPAANGAMDSQDSPTSQPGGATSEGPKRPADRASPPAVRPEDRGDAVPAAGRKGRPPCPPPGAAAILPAGDSCLEGPAAADPGCRHRPDAEPLSLQAPCSQRAPPSPVASPARGG